MSLFTWLRNDRVKPQTRRRAPSTFRPQLESLEGRLVPSFTLASSTQSGPYTDAVVAADVNHDGALDLVTANRGTFNPTTITFSGGSVSVRLGLFGAGHRPNGTFAAPQSYPVGDAMSVAVGDFNGDGKLDIAAGLGDGKISVLLGKGNGIFAQGPITAGGGGSYLAVADVNGDGKLDLISNYGGTSVWLGNGDGSFRAGPSYGGTGSAVAVGDFNGDGRLDIVTALNPYLVGGSFTLSLLNGNGDGTFAGPQTIYVAPAYSVGYTAVFDAITAADLNGDGKLDLAFTSHLEAEVSVYGPLAVSGGVLLGNGNGTFRSGGSFSFMGSPYMSRAGIVAADVNHDGKLDLITVGSDVINGMSVEVVPGHGDGTFGREQDFALAYTAETFTGLAVGDFNGDGYVDVAATWIDRYSGFSALDVWLNDRNWKNFY